MMVTPLPGATMFIACTLVLSLAQPPPQPLESSTVTDLGRFGETVSIDGDRALVCAPYDQNGGSNAGSCTVFERQQGDWIPVFRHDGGPNSTVGSDAAINGDRAVVGVLSDSTGGPRHVLVLERAGGQWDVADRIDAPSPGSLDFAVAVDLDEDHLIVSTRKYVPGDGYVPGALIYRHDPLGWGLEQRIEPTPDPLTGRRPLTAPNSAQVSIDGNLALIGAGASMVGGYSGVGQVLVYERTAPGTWIEAARLAAPVVSSGLGFGGHGQEVQGDRIIVGSPRSPFGSLGLAGAIYVFERAGADWLLDSTLYEPVPSQSAFFGNAVGLDGDRVIGAVAFRPYSADEPLEERVHVFERGSQSEWSHRQAIRTAARSYPDTFGIDVELSGDQMVVGARYAAAFGKRRGAAYVYDVASATRPISVPVCPGTNCGCPAPTRAPWTGCRGGWRRTNQLMTGGSTSISADDLELLAEGVPPSVPAFVLASPQLSPSRTFGFGLACVDVRSALPVGLTTQASQFSEPKGLASRLGTVFGAAGVVVPGDTWYFQVVFREFGVGTPCDTLTASGIYSHIAATAGDRWNLTNAVAVTFTP